MKQGTAELLCLSTPAPSGPKGFSLSLFALLFPTKRDQSSLPALDGAGSGCSAARGMGGEGSRCLQVTNCDFAW